MSDESLSKMTLKFLALSVCRLKLQYLQGRQRTLEDQEDIFGIPFPPRLLIFPSVTNNQLSKEGSVQRPPELRTIQLFQLLLSSQDSSVYCYNI